MNNDEIAKKIIELSISKEYFSHTLNTQVAIFSCIVSAIIIIIVALSWLYNHKLWKQEIATEIEKKFKKEATKSEGRDEKFKNKLLEAFLDQKNDLISLRGEIYRGHGNLWLSQKNYSVAFIWWMRAANEYYTSKTDNMVRLCLDSAKTSLEGIENTYEITTDNIGESQQILNKLTDDSYKIEKEAILDILKQKMRVDEKK